MMYDIEAVKASTDQRRATLTRSWAQHRSIFANLRGVRRTQR